LISALACNKSLDTGGFYSNFEILSISFLLLISLINLSAVAIPALTPVIAELTAVDALA